MNLRIRRRFRDVLFSAADRICAFAGAGTGEGVTHPWIFEAGHRISELGWKFR